MSIEISGTDIAGKLAQELKLTDVKAAKLKIILVGSDPASLRYVRKKEALAKELGVDFELKTFETDVSESVIINQISTWQQEVGRLGIIVQLPLPKNLDRQKIIGAIRPTNDVDGLRYCADLESNYTPPVVRAIDRALDETKVDINDKKIVIIGQGFLVGSPLKKYLINKYPQANIIALGKSDPNWHEEIKTADVLIGAAPVAEIIQPAMIKEGVILVDAGSAEEDNAISGNFARECYRKTSFYTPVPGGIGPLTVAMIYKNLLQAN